MIRAKNAASSQFRLIDYDMLLPILPLRSHKTIDNGRFIDIFTASSIFGRINMLPPIGFSSPCICAKPATRLRSWIPALGQLCEVTAPPSQNRWSWCWGSTALCAGTDATNLESAPTHLPLWRRTFRPWLPTWMPALRCWIRKLFKPWATSASHHHDERQIFNRCTLQLTTTKTGFKWGKDNNPRSNAKA